MRTLTIAVITAFLSCTSAPSQNMNGEDLHGTEVEQGGSSNYKEGTDYHILQRVRVMDQNGFGRPAEAASFLLPKGWKLSGGIQWLVGHPCMNESVASQWSATSPDGTMELRGFPVRSWQWHDDQQVVQDMMRNQQGVMKSCDIMPPYDAEAFVREQVLPELGGASIVSAEPAVALVRTMEEQAQRNNAAVLQAGITNAAFRPSATKVHLRWPDGMEGTLLCSVDQTIFMMPNYLHGGMSGSYQCQSNFRLLVRYPAGKQEEAERIMGTAIASTRFNPAWQQAVAQVFSNVAAVERTEAAKRAGLWRDAQNYTSDLQRRTWEEGQASRDRINTEWGQVIRGVDEWKDPSGSSIELSAGYNDAWSRPDGTYILSNDPNFDPRVVLQEDWQRMEKK
ncbi:MAG: hypothetical protein IPO05_18860 [Flavobacteriales bacterium]|nr:hypothetical protein [Flavobacteriales bacterium]